LARLAAREPMKRRKAKPRPATPRRGN
jgi:hypothetical protein